MESTYLSWSQSGFYQDFIRTPDGLHQDSWGSVTYSLSAGVNICLRSILLPSNRLDTPASSRTQSTMLIRLSPLHKRFLECYEDDPKVLDLLQTICRDHWGLLNINLACFWLLSLCMSRLLRSCNTLWLNTFEWWAAKVILKSLLSHWRYMISCRAQVYW